MRRFNRLSIAFIAFISSLSLFTFALPQTSFAAEAGDWVDVANIKVGTETFTDVNIDDNLNYRLGGSQGNCVSEIKDFNGGKTSAKIIRAKTDPLNGTCQKTEDTITLATPANANIFFNWVDASTIESAYVKWVDVPGGVFNVLAASPNTFGASTASVCKSSITPNGTGDQGEVILRRDFVLSNVIDGAGIGWRQAGKCLEAVPVQRSIGAVANKTKTAGTGTPTNTAGVGTPSNEDPGDSCESKGGAIGWIMCPVINMLDGALNWIDTQIQGFLKIDPGTYNNDRLKKSWTIIRNVAYVILLPIALIMVIGTALGIDAFNAYTVKKALPRMVAAILFITLSWYICTFIIGFFNVVGEGILGLMTNPFYPGGGNMNLSTLFEADAAGATVQWGSIALTALAGVLLFNAGLGLVAIGVLLSLMLGALLFVLIAFIVLLLRQMFIIGLILVAPLAILAWIFPGNDKLWKAWWSIFSKLLIMFPLIMGIIATGRIFAWLLDNGQASNSPLVPVMKLVAYIAPYGAIPFTFKFAGGLFANLAGIVNDRGKGLFDRNRNLRKKMVGYGRKNVGERAKGGKLFQDATEGTNAARWNKRAQRLAHYNKALATGNWKDRNASINAAIQATEKEHQKHIMEDAVFNTYAGYDDVSGAAAAVILNDEHGIKRRLMKLGIGVQKVLDENGNETDKVFYDESGNMVINNRAALDAAVGRVTSHMHAGRRQEALTQMFREAGTFNKTRADGTRYEDTAELETNVAHVMRDSRTYGDEALAQALVKKAGAGGTYYDNAADAWHAADLAAGHDGAARADFAATFRGMLTNAGRADQGGGAFGKTVKFMDDLHKAQERAAANGTDVDVELAALQKEYTKHIKENNPTSILFHHSMKEGYVENNVMPIIIEELEQRAAAAAGKPEDSPEFAAYMKSLADTDNLYQQALQTKPALAEKIANRIMNLKVGPVTQKQRPTGLLDARGNPIMETITDQDTVTAEVYRYKTNPIWQRFHKEWVGADDALRQEQMRQQMGQPPAPGQGVGGNPGQPLGPPRG